MRRQRNEGLNRCCCCSSFHGLIFPQGGCKMSTFFSILEIFFISSYQKKQMMKSWWVCTVWTLLHNQTNQTNSANLAIYAAFLVVKIISSDHFLLLSCLNKQAGAQRTDCQSVRKSVRSRCQGHRQSIGSLHCTRMPHFLVDTRHRILLSCALHNSPQLKLKYLI